MNAATRTRIARTLDAFGDGSLRTLVARMPWLLAYVQTFADGTAELTVLRSLDTADSDSWYRPVADLLDSRPHSVISTETVRRTSLASGYGEIVRYRLDPQSTVTTAAPLQLAMIPVAL